MNKTQIKQREIKFRLWNLENRKWINLFFIQQDGSVQAMWDENGRSIGIKDSILMQDTGLKDKNGKEVYEGDIIQYIEKDYNLLNNLYEVTKYKGVVEWDNDAGKYKIFPSLYFKAIVEQSEVIGNIYENPELLEENKEDRQPVESHSKRIILPKEPEYE